jgi:hypothetical protein
MTTLSSSMDAALGPTKADGLRFFLSVIDLDAGKRATLLDKMNANGFGDVARALARALAKA